MLRQYSGTVVEWVSGSVLQYYSGGLCCLFRKPAAVDDHQAATAMELEPQVRDITTPGDVSLNLTPHSCSQLTHVTTYFLVLAIC